LSAIAGGAAIGAGVGVSSVALAPFNAANTFLGSAFFGYGMILGERYMYQEDWPKIQQRLVNGEKIENIIQEYTGVFTATVMKEAKIIFDTVTREFISIMQEALNPTDSILGGTPQHIPEDAPTIGDPRRTPKPKPPTITQPQTPREFAQGPIPPARPTPQTQPKPTSRISPAQRINILKRISIQQNTLKKLLANINTAYAKPGSPNMQLINQLQFEFRKQDTILQSFKAQLLL